MTVRCVAQQRDTERRGIRDIGSLKHLRPDSRSNSADTKEPLRSPCQHFYRCLVSQKKSRAAGARWQIQLFHQKIDLKLEAAWAMSEQIHSESGVLFCTKPPSLPSKLAPCSCKIWTPKLMFVH